MKKSKKIILGIALVLLAGIYYYIALPAVNIHSSDTWFFLLFLLVVLAVAYPIHLGLCYLSQLYVLQSLLGQ